MRHQASVVWRSGEAAVEVPRVDGAVLLHRRTPTQPGSLVFALVGSQAVGLCHTGAVEVLLHEGHLRREVRLWARGLGHPAGSGMPG
jgi:hypothetical protein